MFRAWKKDNKRSFDGHSERVSGIALPGIDFPAARAVSTRRRTTTSSTGHRLRKAVDGSLEQSVSLVHVLHGGGAVDVVVGAITSASHASSSLIYWRVFPCSALGRSRSPHAVRRRAVSLAAAAAETSVWSTQTRPGWAGCTYQINAQRKFFKFNPLLISRFTYCNHTRYYFNYFNLNFWLIFCFSTEERILSAKIWPLKKKKRLVDILSTRWIFQRFTLLNELIIY